MSTSATTVANQKGVEPLTQSKAWKALESHCAQVSSLHLRDLFAADAGRGERLTVDALGLFFDYSKNRATDETLKLLVELARESGLQARIEAMFRGDKINVRRRENRSWSTARMLCPGFMKCWTG
jgi:glucose-6-phosphate isomerase